MRVVLVVDVFPKVSTTFIAAKFVGLVDRGVDAHVVCWTSEPGMWDRIAQLAARPELRSRVHVAPAVHRPDAAFGMVRTLAAGAAERGGVVATARRIAARRQDLAGRFGLESLLVALQPDLVHFEFGARAARYLRPGQPFGYPVVVSFRGYDLNCGGLDVPGFYDGVWEQAQALHLLGGDLWARALRRGCPPEKPHVLIPPAVDTSFFSPAPREHPEVGTPERPLRLLSIGRLHWKKGYQWSLGAVRLLADRGASVEYHIVGDGLDRQAVEACIADLGLHGSARLAGSLRRAEVRDELAWADVLVHPAVSEGFCNSVMEAQSMELPVVCTDADGLGENVADGASGFVVERWSASALSEGIALLAADTGLRREMGRAGRARVADRFRPDEQIDAFLSLYRSVHDGITS
ncbi:MAG: glycosyltransferase family 4 protein [Acidimicrobiales bacterium]